MGRMEEIAQKAGDLPALPQVASRVMQLVSDPETSAEALENVILRDQAMTAKVLKISNSALFGMRHRIGTLSQAIPLLGFRTLRSLVVAASTEALFRAKKSCFKDKILWEHSLAVALTARLLARESGYTEVEQAFIAGLIHDIGKPVLDKNLGDEYQAVVEHVFNRQGTFHEAEMERFGFDHAEIGSLVVTKWKLAEELEEAVRLHHSPKKAELDPVLCASVSLANLICVKLGIGPERDSELDLSYAEATSMLNIDPEQLDLIFNTVEETLAIEKEMFSLT